jgi:hypothetical protein
VGKSKEDNQNSLGRPEIERKDNFMISRTVSELETLRMMNAEKDALIFTLEKENGKLKEENSVLNRELLCFKMGYGSTNNKELKEENRQLRNLVEEYTNRITKQTRSIVDLNNEKNTLKEEIENLKFGDQKFCYLDELIKINKESLKEKTELKRTLEQRNKTIENLYEENKRMKEKLEGIQTVLNMVVS